MTGYLFQLYNPGKLTLPSGILLTGSVRGISATTIAGWLEKLPCFRVVTFNKKQAENTPVLIAVCDRVACAIDPFDGENVVTGLSAANSVSCQAESVGFGFPNPQRANLQNPKSDHLHFALVPNPAAPRIITAASPMLQLRARLLVSINRVVDSSGVR